MRTGGWRKVVDAADRAADGAGRTPVDGTDDAAAVAAVAAVAGVAAVAAVPAVADDGGAEAAAAVAGFAKTGRLGDFGLDEPAGFADLGEGMRVTGKHAWPKWYVVGDAEITVCGCGRMQTVSLQTHRDTVGVPQPGGAPPLDLAGPVTLRRLAHAFARHGLRSRPEPRQYPGGLYLEVAGTGVHLVFDLECGPEPILHSAGLWSMNHRDCRSRVTGGSGVYAV